MTKRQKRLERIRQNPKNVRFEDLRQVLEDHGFYVDRIVGSHYSFKREGQPDIFVCPFRRPTVKAVCVKRALERIDALNQSEPMADSEDEDDE